MKSPTNISEILAENERLRKENEELKVWKESELLTVGQCDLQKLAKILGIGLGESIYPNLIPKFEALAARLAAAEVEQSLLAGENTAYLCSILAAKKRIAALRHNGHVCEYRQFIDSLFDKSEIALDWAKACGEHEVFMRTSDAVEWQQKAEVLAASLAALRKALEEIRSMAGMTSGIRDLYPKIMMIVREVTS